MVNKHVVSESFHKWIGYSGAYQKVLMTHFHELLINCTLFYCSDEISIEDNAYYAFFFRPFV